MSNLRYHVASDRRKWAFVFIALLLIVAVLVTGILSDWFTNWNKYCLFGHDYDENGICTRCGAEKLDEVKPDDGDNKEPVILHGGVLANVADENGIKLKTARVANYDYQNEVYIHNSYQLTATITPSHADDKTVDWSIRWKNAESEFAQDKNVEDYCTITPMEDGALTATLKNLQAFGEQIEVVVTSRDNPDAQAICLVDYVQKITAFTFNMGALIDGDNTFSYDVESTVYTIPANISVTISDTISLTYGFRGALEQDINEYTSDPETYPRIPTDLFSHFSFIDAKLTTNYSTKTITVSRSNSYPDYQGVTPGDNLAGYFLAYDDGQSFDTLESYLGSDPFLVIFKNSMRWYQSGHVSFEVTYKSTYNGVDYSSGSQAIELNINADSLRVPVSDISLDDHVLF